MTKHRPAQVAINWPDIMCFQGVLDLPVSGFRPSLRAEVIRRQQQKAVFVNTDIFSCLIWRMKAGFLLRQSVLKR